MARRVLVCGPPAAGKSTYVRENAPPDALVLDLDEIARGMGSVGWDHPPEIRWAADKKMREEIASLPQGREAWIIRSTPDRKQRNALVAELGAETVLIDTPPEVAKARAVTDGRPEWTAAAIDKWWTEYQRTTPKSTPAGHPGGPIPTGDPAMTETPQQTAPQAPVAEPATGQLPTDHPLVTALERQKAENKALKERAAKLDEIEEASKTELQKFIDRATAAEKKAADLEAAEKDRQEAAARAKEIAGWVEAAAEKNSVPESLIRGASKDEIDAHAAALKAAFPDRRGTSPRAGILPDEGNSELRAAVRQLFNSDA